jgi:hypothetical protein
MTHYINPKITDREKEIIKGTVLGGSTIIKPTGGKNCYLSMRSKDGQWLDYKAYELKNLSSSAPMTIEKTNRWHSLCYPVFSDIYKMFWDQKKRSINETHLDCLTYISYMIWFGDCGTYKDGIVILNTHIWGEEGSNKICNYLGKAGFKSEVFAERKNFRIKLDESSSYNFIRNISPNMPHFMAVKLS